MSGLLQKLGQKLVPIVTMSVVGLAIPYLALQAYYFSVSSDYFAIETVGMRGTEQSDPTTLLEMAGLSVGLNIFDVDTPRMETLLESDAWVKEARVEAHLPNTVDVIITEHQPVAILVDADGMWLVNEDGLAFKTLSDQEGPKLLAELPLFTGVDPAGFSADGGGRRFAEAMAAREFYVAAGLEKGHPLSELHIDLVMGISLVTRDGIEIRLGHGQMDERIRRVASVMKALEQDEVVAEYILADGEEDLDRISVGKVMMGSKDAPQVHNY